MVSINFFPLDIDYINYKSIKGIRVFGRTENGKKVYVIDKNFEQYFWIILDSGHNESLAKKILDLKLNHNDELVYATKLEPQKKKYLGKEVDALKVHINNPLGIDQIRSAIWGMKGVEGIKEIDIPIHRRYLIDKQIDLLKLFSVNGELKDYGWDADLTIEGQVIPLQFSSQEEKIFKPKILAFDIEISSPERYPRVEKDQIILISLFGEDFKKVFALGKITSLDYVECARDEAELIEKFKDAVKVHSPDYLVGYFSDGFDLPYLKRRAEINNLKLDLGLDSEPIKIHKTRGAEISGIIHIDILSFIRNILGNSLKVDSFSLNTIATALLGEKKEKIDFKTFVDISGKESFEELYRYGLKDAELTYKLCKKVLPNLHEITRLINQPVFDISRMRFSQLVEWYIIKNIGKFNEVCPNKPWHYKSRELKSYEGAFVFEPKPGLYEDLIVFDFRSLYPSLISTKNICPSTFVEKGSDAYETQPINGKRYYFSKKQRGFIPQIIEELIEKRMNVKQSMTTAKDIILRAREQSLKLLANAMYGYYGFAGARWYCLEAAASVTAFGREYIHKTIGRVEKAGFRVIYADTDSIVIILGNKTKEEAMGILNKINKELPDMMELELEGFYPRGIFVTKKRETKGAKKKYALVDSEGKIKVIGFETVRRDWSTIAKNVQEKVLELVLKEKKIGKAAEHVQEIILKIRKKKVDKKDMIIQSQLRKSLDDYEQIGPHVAVARRMKEKGFNVEPGTIIRYIVMDGNGMIRDKARFIHEVENGKEEYDSEYYINNQIYPAVEGIFNVLGYTKEFLTGDQKQKKLEEFQGKNIKFI